MAKTNRFGIHSFTDIGKRDENQDRIFAADRSDMCLCAVCDGVGSLSDGGYASRFTCDELSSWFDSLPSKDISALKSLLLSEISDINIKLIAYAEEKKITTGTTLSLVLFRGRDYIAANIGDSRIYRLSGLKLEKLTEDDSVFMSQSDGVSRNVLTQCMGLHSYIKPSVYESTAARGEKLLLCSDGFWRLSTPHRIRLAMLCGGLASQCARLRKTGEEDNVSAAIINIK